MLLDNCTLTELRVNHNKIGDAGIEAIAHGVHENRESAILFLRLEGNRATGIGRDAMAAAQRAHELREGLREQVSGLQVQPVVQQVSGLQVQPVVQQVSGLQVQPVVQQVSGLQVQPVQTVL
jgi:hypothetical protein